jgi:hypothetical protein
MGPHTPSCLRTSGASNMSLECRRATSTEALDDSSDVAGYVETPNASTRGFPYGRFQLYDRPKRRNKRRTRGNGPGRRRSVELHAQYLKLLIMLITLISPIVQHYMR